MADGDIQNQRSDQRGMIWLAALRRVVPWLLIALLVGSLGTLLYTARTASRDHAQALAEQQRSFEIIALARGFEARIARAVVRSGS